MDFEISYEFTLLYLWPDRCRLKIAEESRVLLGDLKDWIRFHALLPLSPGITYTVSESEEGTEINKEINHLTLQHLDTLRLQIVLLGYKDSACLKAVIVDNSLTSELISQTAQLILVCPSSSRNIIGLNLSAGSKPFKLTFENRVRYFSN